MGYIYKITNTLNNKIYIGQTINSIQKRWSSHKSDVKRRNTPLYLSMKKVDGEIDKYFTIEIIEELDDILLDDREIHWIKELNTMHPNGYNMSEGGYAYLTDEEKDRIRVRVSGENNPMYGMYGELNPFYGKKHNDETKELLRGLAKNRIKSEEEKLKIGEAVKLRHKETGHPFQGKHHTEEAKIKIAEAMKDRHFSDEHKEKIKANVKRITPVDMLDKDGNYIMTFERIVYAGEWLRENTEFKKSTYPNISMVCSGKRKSAYGYKWRISEGQETIENTSI